MNALKWNFFDTDKKNKVGKVSGTWVSKVPKDSQCKGRVTRQTSNGCTKMEGMVSYLFLGAPSPRICSVETSAPFALVPQ